MSDAVWKVEEALSRGRDYIASSSADSGLGIRDSTMTFWSLVWFDGADHLETDLYGQIIWIDSGPSRSDSTMMFWS